MKNIVTLNFGDSFVTSARPPAALGAMLRSAKLAGLALLLTIPIRIPAGVFAARRRDKRCGPGDRAVRRDVVVDPRVRDRHVPRRRGRRRARLAARGSATPPREPA